MTINKKNLYKLYIIKKLTMQEIANKLGRCRAGIFKLLKKFKIQTRDRGQHKRWNKDLRGYKLPGAGFKKGHIPWNKGLTKENNISLATMAKNRLGKNHWLYGKEPWNKHRPWSKEVKSKLSLSHGGTGIPYQNTEYGSEFDNALKEQIRFRDQYKCRMCGCSQLENGKQLDVHHVDYNKNHNIQKNLISLCMKCHRKTNSNREYWKQYFYLDVVVNDVYFNH